MGVLIYELVQIFIKEKKNERICFEISSLEISMLYGRPTISGLIVKQGESFCQDNKGTLEKNKKSAPKTGALFLFFWLHALGYLL